MPSGRLDHAPGEQPAPGGSPGLRRVSRRGPRRWSAPEERNDPPGVHQRSGYRARRDCAARGADAVGAAALRPWVGQATCGGAVSMSTIPFSAPSPGDHRPTSPVSGGVTGRAVRRLTLGSGPLKRTSDRIEVLSRLILAIVLVLAAPVALAAATVDLRATAQQQSASRNQAVAVLLEDALSRPLARSGTTTAADAAWTAPDGTTRHGMVPARPAMRAGDSVPIWIDEGGALTSAPPTKRDLTAGTTIVGGGTFVVIVAAAAAGHALTCGALNRHRDRRWAADWAAVEPSWSGRLR